MQQETDGKLTNNNNNNNHKFNVSLIKAIVSPKCMVCGCPFLEDQVINCVGVPYMMILHESCTPFYPYSTKPWPHPMPLDYYNTNGSTVYKH